MVVGRIGSVAVSEEIRGRGVGSCLIQLAEEWARKSQGDFLSCAKRNYWPKVRTHPTCREAAIADSSVRSGEG
ncbi:GNAT family N-acetyltransferase [Paraburkholderia caribensis]|uniref:GNAT family N-acetyltransferase n=1 Tax=Paraburkholderia caribensis TaxID=75105 RepID=UPI001E39F51A|nr:GNAT family N-acetyltransferase [Paraburkholderia caribensis]